MDRIFKQFVKKTHLRNYYHEDEGHRGVDVARIVRAFLIQIDWRHVEKATWKMPSERRRNSETNIHVYACILLHIGIEAKPRPRMRVRFALRFLASAFSKLNPCIFPSLFFFNTIFTWRIFFFFHSIFAQRMPGYLDQSRVSLSPWFVIICYYIFV